MAGSSRQVASGRQVSWSASRQACDPQVGRQAPHGGVRKGGEEEGQAMVLTVANRAEPLPLPQATHLPSMPTDTTLPVFLDGSSTKTPTQCVMSSPAANPGVMASRPSRGTEQAMAIGPLRLRW